MGYKGMSKLASQATRNIQSRGGLGGGSSVYDPQEDDDFGTVSTAKNAQMNNNSNPFIGDSYFQNNPSKVLGEQIIEKGKWGNDIIKVKGDFSAIQKIDAVPVQVVDFYPTEVYTDETRAEVIQQVFTEENKAQNTKAIKEIRTRGKKKDAPAAAGNRVPQEIYSFREVGKMYNDNISVDEMDAYYFTHPELNYKLLFDDYTNDKNSLIEKGLICYEDGKWVYYFTYISGNVNKKISNLQKDKEKTISAIGQAQYDRQMKMLMDVRPKARGFVGDDKIILLPHSNFAKEIEITELRSGKPELNGSNTLFYAFKKWLRVQPPDMFKKSNYREVIDFYLDNKSLEVSKDLKGKEKEKAEKNAINIKQRTKEEGDALFAQFLAEELTPDDQAKVSYLWNEKFNSIVEPDLSKIPVCFEVAKTWKNNAPFRLNNTQRQAVAFMMEKKSGLLAYGVGVGKTASSIMSFAQAYYNGLAKRGVMVVPTNTYPNWLGEIQGYVDKDSGAFMQGIMPQLPPIVGLFNLNPQIVKDVLKVYSDTDEATLFSIMQAIELLKTYKDELSGARKMEISKVYDLNWNGLMGEYEFMMENSERKTVTSFPEFVIKYLTTEYNYKIYELGVIKSFPDGTIFVTTEVGLQRLGVSEENKSDLVSTMFTILSQGEKSNDDARDSEKKIAALQLKIEQTVSSSMKNAKLNIEDLGIDWACFDEAHYYKKLFTFVKGSITEDAADSWNGKTKREKSKYELKSGSVPSSRALSAFVLSHYIQQKNDNRNVVMLTATPFTNSPLEVFSMLTLTNYKELEDLGLSNMTDFFDTFMKINYDIKYTPQKTVVKDIVLTGYNNLPQLRQIIYSLMDKKDAGANLIRPDKHIWPSLERGIETTLPMTLEQSELMKVVKDYINGNNEYEQICRSAIVDEISNTDFDGFDDDTLIAEWERNTGKEYTGDRDGLSDSVRDNLIKQIKSTHEDGVEMEEGDLDEAESLGVRILRGLSMMRQITLSPYLYYKACRKAINEAAVLPDAEDYVTTSPKLMYVAGCVKSVIDYHRERDEKISGQVIYMNAGVEYFILIKQYLAKFCNIKESQIGIVSGQMSKNAKENVKRQFLNGDIIILIGSSTISVGVNLQDNATTLYNCYYDWNPTDAAQIEGRIWRQGNRFANVRIVYPQCYNSADPVIFEYLNSKTLRINEIWNRSSELQELDLRDFNPKELQKKLITDPEEKADWEILKETDEISSKVIYFENRRELLTTALSSYRQYKQMKPEVINILNRMSAKKMELAKKEAVSAQKEKIAKIVDEFSEDTEKMAKEISNYKKTRYDHENDPEGKYKSTDYNTVDSERIYNDCSKYIDILSDMDYRDDDQWGDIYREHNQLERILTNFRYNFKDMRASEYKVLQPMGLSFDTAENPIADFNAKLEELNAQLQGIEESKPERIKRIKEELASQEHTMKTVPERIAEFASYNQAMLSKYLIAPVAEKPHELPAPTEQAILDEGQAAALREMGAIPTEDMVPVVEMPTEEEVAETPLEELQRYAEIAKTFGLFKSFVSQSDNVQALGEQIGAVAGDKEGNVKKLEDFYNAERKALKIRRAARKADVARMTAEANVEKIVRLALQANDDMERLLNSETVQTHIPNIAKFIRDNTSGMGGDEPQDDDVAVMEMEPPVEQEVINEPAPEPVSVSEVMESSRENILSEINDLNLAIKYADAEEKKNIKEAIAALKISLKYI